MINRTFIAINDALTAILIVSFGGFTAYLIVTGLTGLVAGS